MSIIQFFMSIIYSSKEEREIEEFLKEFEPEEREIIKSLCLS